MDAWIKALDQLMKELGPVTDEVALVVKDSVSSWALRFDSGRTINLALRDAPPRLELTMKVCGLPAGNASQVMRSLLMFNFLSPDTGGTRFGLGTPGDIVFLMRDLAPTGLTVADLQSSVRLALRAADAWADFVRGASQNSSSSSHAAAAVQHLV